MRLPCAAKNLLAKREGSPLNQTRPNQLALGQTAMPFLGLCPIRRNQQLSNADTRRANAREQPDTLHWLWRRSVRANVVDGRAGRPARRFAGGFGRFGEA